MAEDLPDLVTHFKADLSGLETGIARGEMLVHGFRDELTDTLAGGGAGGEGLGRDLGSSIAKGMRDAEPQVRDAAEATGRDAGDSVGRGMLAKMFPNAGFEQAGEKAGLDVGNGVSKGVEPGLDEADRKVVDRMRKSGADAGAAAGQGMSPLIVAAIAGAGAIGAPLLVGALGTAMVGVTALVLKNNQVISADFTKVGRDAENAVKQAAAPLAAEMNQALLGVDKQVKEMAPDLKNLFAAVEPDIATVTSGITGLVGNVLPGLSSALSRGQTIVTDFSASLPVLGSDIGRFFSALVVNADSEGRALQATLNSLGNTVYTVGSLLGSSATAVSPILIGVTHALNGLDDVVRSVGSPAVVGGALGLFGAMKLDPAISTGLQNVSNGLVNVAAKADGAGGILGKAGSFAEKAAGGFGKMADIVGGPWGLAIGAGVGLLSGFIGQLGQADDATKAITVSEGQLADAVASDMGKVGQSTTAFIAAQAQASGLADEAKNAGVSLSLLTEAATGNQAAMSQLTAVTGAANDVSRQQQLATVAQFNGQQQLTDVQQRGSVAVNSLYSSTVQLASGQQQLNTQFTTGSVRLAQGMVASNTLTTANQQLLNSVRAQTQQVADAINKQTALDAATAALNNTTSIFNATLDAARQKLAAKSQATADNTVAALGLSDGQSSLNQLLAASVQKYDEATTGANAYDQVLTAMNGTVATLLGSEASFTIALDGVTKAAQANGTSLDVNNLKGAQNVQTFTQVAGAADKAAGALYESEVNTKGASVAYDDANRKLTQEKQAFIDAADKAGFNRDEVKKLADELYKLPPDVPVAIEVNTSTAQDQVNGLLRWVDSQTGTITVQAQDGSGISYNPKAGGGKALYDWGGWTKAAAGQPEEATVHGGEYVLSQGMLAGTQAVDPRVLAALRAGAAGYGAAAAAGAPGGLGGGMQVLVTAPIYLDGQLVGQAMTRGVTAEAQNTARRNSITGLAGNYR